MVEPVDPFEGGELDRFEVTPGAASTNHLGLVQADDRLGQGPVHFYLDFFSRLRRVSFEKARQSCRALEDLSCLEWRIDHEAVD